MKKKILMISIAAVIAVMAIAGASLAYLTDTDQADNVFAVGNVQIELVEQQRDENGVLEPFEAEKTLMPIVGSAQGTKDALGLPTAKNYVDKIVTVDNTGMSDAYVRVVVAIPAALDYPDGPLHWNLGDNFNGATPAAYAKEVVWKFINTEDVDGVSCNIYTFTYQTAVATGESTPFAAIVGFYLDKSVDNKIVDDELVYTYKDDVVDYDLTEGVTIPVFAQAVQAAGFDSADEAFTAAELPTNPWA